MTLRTRVTGLVGAILALALAGIVAFGAAVSELRGEVAEALGSQSETRAIHVGLAGVVLEGLRIPAPSDWPASDALRAEQVAIAPSLRSLVSGDEVRIRSIRVHAPYLSALRGRLQAYLVCPGEAGARRGGLDLELKSDVMGQRLNARGRVTLADLELAPAHGLANSCLGGTLGVRRGRGRPRRAWAARSWVCSRRSPSASRREAAPPFVQTRAAARALPLLFQRADRHVGCSSVERTANRGDRLDASHADRPVRSRKRLTNRVAHGFRGDARSECSRSDSDARADTPRGGDRLDQARRLDGDRGARITACTAID